MGNVPIEPVSHLFLKENTIGFIHFMGVKRVLGMQYTDRSSKNRAKSAFAPLHPERLRLLLQLRQDLGRLPAQDLPLVLASTDSRLHVMTIVYVLLKPTSGTHGYAYIYIESARLHFVHHEYHYIIPYI